MTLEARDLDQDDVAPLCERQPAAVGRPRDRVRAHEVRRQARLAAVVAEHDPRCQRDVGTVRTDAQARAVVAEERARVQEPAGLEERDHRLRAEPLEPPAHPNVEPEHGAGGRQPGDVGDLDVELGGCVGDVRVPAAREPHRSGADQRLRARGTVGARRPEAQDARADGTGENAVRPPGDGAGRHLVQRPLGRALEDGRDRGPALRRATAVGGDGVLERATGLVPGRCERGQCDRPAPTALPRHHHELAGDAGVPQAPRHACVDRRGRRAGRLLAAALAESVHRRHRDEPGERGRESPVREPPYEADTASATSCSPKRARFTNWPVPGWATTSPPSTITLPRRSTVSTSPTTSVPS